MAQIRTFNLTPKVPLEAVSEGLRERELKVNDELTLSVGVANGLTNAKILLRVFVKDGTEIKYADVLQKVRLALKKEGIKANKVVCQKNGACAFTYLDKVGVLTGNEIQAVLGGELRHVVKEPLSEHIPFTEQSLKEKST